MPSVATGVRKERLLSGDFLLTSVSALAFFGSFQLQLPTLPLYILFIGGNESQVGLILGVFAITATVLRPFVGRASDQQGRRLFLLGGAFIFVLAPVLYSFTTSVAALLALRLFHGAGIALFTTAATALIADLAPSNRRGEAMGYFGMFSNLAIAIAPALGMVILAATDFAVLFLASAAVALLSLLLALFIREPQVSPQSSSPNSALLNRPALLPALLVVCLTITLGAVISFVPLFAVQRGLDNPGFYFTAYAIALFLARGIAGTLSDRYGRGPVLLPGFLVLGLATSLLGLATSLPGFLILGFLLGIGFGAAHPALLAYLLDRTGDEGRGAAMGTFTAGFDLGIGIGSMVGGFIAGAVGLGPMFLLAAAPAVAGMVIFVISEGGLGARGSRQP